MGKNYDKTLINGVNGDLLFTNKIAVPGIDIISANGSSYGSITVDNTSDSILFNDVKLATATDLANKVDKVDGKGLSTNDFTTEYKNKIDANSTSISALQGVFIYIGVITKANPTDQELTARATELKGDVKLGYVLVDNNKVEYYYDGINWNNMGQNIISNGTISVAGIVKIGGSTLSSTPASDVASTEAAVKTYVDNAIANIDIPSSVKSLSFKVPTIPSSEVYHLTIEFSSTLGFTNPTIFKTNVTEDLIKFKVSTGTQITNYPAAGLGIPFIGETVFFDFSSVDESLKYFRYRWFDSGNNYSSYGFGQTDSLLQVFDIPETDLSNYYTKTETDNKLDDKLNIADISTNAVKSIQGLKGDVTLVQGSNVTITKSGQNITISAIAPEGGLSSVSIGDGLAGNGTSSNPLKLNIQDYNSDEDIGLTTSGGMYLTTRNFILMCTSPSGTGSIQLNGSDIVWNGANINSANGLVTLNVDGKIPNDLLYDTGSVDLSDYTNPAISLTATNNMTLHGNKVNITSATTAMGNITLSSPDIRLGATGSNNQVFVEGLMFNIRSQQVMLDGHKLNEASGLVKLGTDGKIPTNLYNAGSSIDWTNITEPIVSFGSNGSNTGGFSVYSDSITLEGSTIAFSSSSAPTLNGHAANTALGFVVIGEDGKIPSNLYNAGSGTVDLSNYQGNTKITSNLEGKHEIIAQSGNENYTSKLTVGTGHITLDSDDVTIEGQGAVNINSGNKITLSCTNTTELIGNVVEITTPDLRLNSAPKNTAGGLVVVGEDGKIPSDLYDAGSSSGVTSINGINGVTTISAGTNVEIENVGRDIKINTIIPTIENKSLLIQLNGSNVTESNYTVTYDNTSYKITVVHNLGNRVHGTLFDENNKQAFIGVDYVDDNTISMQFTAEYMPTTSKVWTLIIDATGSYLMGGNTHTIKQAVGLESRAPGVIAMSDARYEINKYSSAVSEGTLAFTYSSIGYHAQYIRTMELWINATSNITNITFDENLRNINVPTTLNMVDGSTITTHVFAVREIDGTTACISHCYSFKMS